MNVSELLAILHDAPLKAEVIIDLPEGRVDINDVFWDNDEFFDAVVHITAS